MLDYFFPRYTRSRVAQPVLFVTATVSFIVIDALSVKFGIYAFDISHVLPILGLSILFALAGFFQVCEFLFIVCYITANACDVIGSFTAPSFGISIVLVFWLMRSWIVPAIGVMIIDVVVSIAVSTTPQLQLFSSIIVSSLSLIIGLTLRWQNSRRILAEIQQEQARDAAEQIKQELARQLHDTTAKDLAHVAVLAQDLKVHHPDLASELDALISVATSASRRIRPMILSIDTTARETPLSDVVTQVTAMLKTRNIMLETSIAGDIDTVLVRQQRLVAALAIRECASNILKYAPAYSEANLEMETYAAPGVLTISLSNQISSQPAVPSMSSGYGLANLSSKIRSEGGTIDSSNIGQQWVTYITLPRYAPMLEEKARVTHENRLAEKKAKE